MSTPRILGLDVSTKTGMARPDGTTLRFTLRTPPADQPRRLHELTSRLNAEIRRWPPAPDLVVIEGASLGGPGVQSKLVLASFRAVVIERLFAWGLQTVEVKPSMLKRYATGNGSAKKPAMIAAARHEGAVVANDDEADAWWCWHAAQVAYGLLPPTRITDPEQARHLTSARSGVVAGLTWPVLR